MPTRKFRELLEAMPVEPQRKIEKRFQKSLAAMPLDQLRKARQMTQLQLAEILGVIQVRSRKSSTGRTCVSAPWPNTLKRWAGASRSARCSRTGKYESRSSRNWQARPVS